MLMNKKSLLAVGKGIICAYVVTAVILVILSFLLYRFHIPDSAVKGGIIFSYVFSCFVGGMVVSKVPEGRKYLWGLLTGVIYCVILLAVSMVWNRMMFANLSGTMSVCFLCLMGGMLGGMLQAGKIVRP